MAFAIGFQCTACGGCRSICPNGAIQGARPRYRIEPLLCTECALYSDYPVCVEACPAGAIIEIPFAAQKSGENRARK